MSIFIFFLRSNNLKNHTALSLRIDHDQSLQNNGFSLYEVNKIKFYCFIGLFDYIFAIAISFFEFEYKEKKHSNSFVQDIRLKAKYYTHVEFIDFVCKQAKSKR